MIKKELFRLKKETLMIKGIGTDFLYFDTIIPLVENPQDPFVQKAFTPAEQALILGREYPLACYATRYAGKEAVFKALGTNGDALRFDEIEILATADGAPVVTLLGNAKKIAEEKGITEVLLSLSYEKDCAIAYAIAQ